MDPGERLALFSVCINLLITGLKYALGVFSGSLALLADAVHSSADVVSSASIWAGIKLSRRKTKRFPFGLYKVENLVALITAALILLAGYEIVGTVLGEAEGVKAERLPVAMLGVMIISAILWSFSRYELKHARGLSSPSLEADAQHLTIDLFSTGVILVGLAGTYWQVKFPLDRAVALVIVVLIFWVGLKIALDAVRVLLDASLDYQTLNTIRETILESAQVSKINSLAGRNSGRFKFIDLDLAFKVRKLEEAHLLATQIENRIRSRVANVDHILIHYEPMQKDTLVVALPVTEDHLHLSEHFGEAPYFLLLTLRAQDQTMAEERLLLNPHRTVPSGKGIRVSEWLIGLGVDEIVAAKSFDHKGPYYVFADAGVTTRQTEQREVEQIKAELVGSAEPTEPALSPEASGTDQDTVLS